MAVSGTSAVEPSVKHFVN